MDTLKIDKKIGEKKVKECIRRSQEYLLSRQHSDGYWTGILEADVSVVADYIILGRILGINSKRREEKAVNYLLENQNMDGSWSLFWKGNGSLDVTIKSYFCLKMSGLSSDTEYMRKARNFILKNGGIENANTYTKIILALFGQYPWKKIPEIPPEIIFLPDWFYISIYDFASWARATIMAFSIIITLKPIFSLKKEENIFELYLHTKNINNPETKKLKHLYNAGSIFVLLNGVFKLWDRIPEKMKPGRSKAIKKVEEWILEHQEDDGSWGGIMLPWLFSLIALKCLGYKETHPVIRKGIKGLENFIVEDSRIMVLQPATSPVWDTAWTLIALRQSGLESCHPQLLKGANWLMDKQINVCGDWKIKNPGIKPGCWSFEFENKFYPDIDDTSVVCWALSLIEVQDRKKRDEAVKKGINWVISMQNNDGSWAAFDRNNHKKILRHIPFADFITPLDFGSPDITAHVLSILGKQYCSNNSNKDGNKGEAIYNINANSFTDKKVILKALNYLRKTQREDGSWYGRWGVNFIYGTSKVLQALESLGNCISEYNPCYINKDKAVKWLKSSQNEDGGWGESCSSYEINKYCSLGESTASQTAWALQGLLSVSGEEVSEEVLKGINYLTESQQDNGSWNEKHFTGGGFPGAFYLKYELYKDYFPLMALAKFIKVKEK